MSDYEDGDFYEALQQEWDEYDKQTEMAGGVWTGEQWVFPEDSQ